MRSKPGPEAAIAAQDFQQGGEGVQGRPRSWGASLNCGQWKAWWLRRPGATLFSSAGVSCPSAAPAHVALPEHSLEFLTAAF